MKHRALVVDNRDSFVFNLVDDLARLGVEAETFRSGLSLEALEGRIDDLRPDLILLSPGPGHPADAGVMVPFLTARPRRPVLGVCLGFQAMVHALGGEVGPAPRPVHGRAVPIVHDGDELFDGIEVGFRAGRYHSLVATRVPDDLHVIARTEDAPPLVMAARHRELPWVGLQFHPESVLTPYGSRLVANILRTLT